MSKPIYIIGHRNPDTDSICSAVAYANLKTALGEHVVPARAGKINAETKYVLELFGVQPPQLILDIYPRAKDVMHENIITIHPWNTLRKLGQLIQSHKLKSIPVVENDGKLVGIVTVSDLAERYVSELGMQDLRETGVNYAGILRCLNGTLVCGGELSRIIEGRVKIAASRTQTMAKVINSGDIVLVGNRTKVQLACIEVGVSCLIVTGDFEVAPEVETAAQAAGTYIIRAPQDTYTCARLINQSIPVRNIMKTNVASFKPEDMVSDIKNSIIRTGYRNYPVAQAGNLVGLIDRDRLIVPERDQVILVDHNERSQAVDGIEEAKIVEIIDHHRLGGLETSEPIFIRHEPVGSTATIVANMHWQRNVPIPKSIAGLLLAAIISDTVLFKSPTATKKDCDTANKLAQIVGLTIQDFGMAMLKAGSVIDKLTPADIVAADLKEFQIGEYYVAISQLSVMDPEGVLQQQSQLEAALQAICNKEQYNMAILLITGIVDEATYLLYYGQPAGLIAAAFGEGRPDGTWYLPGVMSRKKQVVPPLIDAVRRS
ncbi:Cobalt-dependent inorganic pyrophosphatase [Sporomusa silvacetica DSM 10669]|uniref:inorganic diphosphatase n=1 Tax=Sporomusa silvacetica DSM 10669 TaxID=1123289 RepID=A0ABZ3INH2_9FIRM|nr:putative manganese-dependent inorganic diphosphatase [Sporomusa silvacetica]OZC18179.1 cobalt-dependent inorganic pyrophosphatase [Sporomusa silvacetica DSM 10669]